MECMDPPAWMIIGSGGLDGWILDKGVGKVPMMERRVEILLMEEILHHLTCMKPCKYVNNGINYQPQLVSRISSINSMCGRFV